MGVPSRHGPSLSGEGRDFVEALTPEGVQTLMGGRESKNRMDSGPIEPKGRPRAAALRPGVVVGGKFVLLRQIGQGAVGAIFEAEDTWIGRRVALKVLHPHAARH